MIWLILLGLTVFALAWVIVPTLSYKNNSSDAQANARQLYHDQITALETDVKEGLIDPEEAQSARLEIQRRLLRISAQTSNTSAAHKQSKLSLTSLLVVCMLGIAAAFGFYWSIGKPGLEGMRPEATMAAKELQNNADLSTQLKQLTSHLDSNPNDKEGWRLMASITAQTGQFQDAANAYGQLARLESENADWWILQAESLIRLARGQVTPAARYSLQTGLMQNPEHPAGRFYLGQALAQDNNHQGALEVWQGLKDVSKPNAPWMRALNARMAQSREILGIETPQEAAPDLGDSNSDAASGDNSSNTPNTNGAPVQFSEEQLTMIRGMVSGLDQRLQTEGGSLEEWLRLAQSYMVLDDRAGAVRALEGALPLADENLAAEIRAQITKLKTP